MDNEKYVKVQKIKKKLCEGNDGYKQLLRGGSEIEFFFFRGER